MNYDDHENMLYDFSCIQAIFRVNIHESLTKLNTRVDLPLNKDDVLAFLMVYYEDDDG